MTISAEKILPEPSLTEVADGVFAYLQPDGGWCVSNAGLVVSDGVAALVDTAATEARTRLLREHVTADGRPAPAVLVNTHSHGDHTFGNHLFPEATIFAHAHARNEMDRAGLHLTELWPGVVWGDVRVALPQVTYRDPVTVHVGGLAVELVPVGPAHTTNDTVVWVPERGVLFTGDIVMSGVTPFCPLGSIAGSLRAVDELRRFGATTLVTGHGPVGGPEILDVAERYLRWVRDLAREGVAAGSTPLEVARAADLGPFAELKEPERLVPNLHRAFAEERSTALGEELDIVAMAREMGVIFQEMVTYKGEPLSCCA
ncbi:MBL fold metallo-hydrolase [Micromonospora sp. NPDC002296]|uniref:MBL fold metallo-hydrolase n=1 Tax=Micromonospora sp. NPDC002296 TaxID=3154271 RepID=UPI0033185E0B